MAIRSAIFVSILVSISLFFGTAALAEDAPATSDAAGSETETEAAAEPPQEPGKEHRANYRNKTGFGGPSAINVQLDKDDEVKEPVFRLEVMDKALQPWFDIKKYVHEQIGLQIGMDYTITTQHAEKPLTDNDTAGVGIARLFGKWELLGRGTKDVGSFFVKGEHRHRTADSAPGSPADAGRDLGYAGIPATLFNDTEWILNEFNWQQYFDDAETGLIIGRFDPNDYMDVSGHANPWEDFQNVAVLLNPSIALPDTSWGIGIGHWWSNQFYVVATLNDANGVISENEFKPFEEGPEFFKQVGIGWTPDRAKRFSHNLQVTFWHVDARDHIASKESEGIALNAGWTFDDSWMIFTKMGWSDGDSANEFYDESYTFGAIHYFKNRTDELGVAVNWGELPVKGLDDQVTTEVFYKMQLAQRLATTFSLQWLKDPAFNPERENVYLLGLRVRLTL
ncbi:MAG: carbohydrate porin [Deltaproteobacteria bacterium]|nr:carbohydrate porin [Deltaproteobacteria bacterium]